jgi:transcriptional regulator with XRE-family HTH domain
MREETAVDETGSGRRTVSEWQRELGAQLRELRIRAQLTQEDLAHRAALGLSSVKHLEAGRGANLTSLVKAVRALGREDWLESLAPASATTVSPMRLLRERQVTPPPRRRVRTSRP